MFYLKRLSKNVKLINMLFFLLLIVLFLLSFSYSIFAGYFFIIIDFTLLYVISKILIYNNSNIKNLGILFFIKSIFVIISLYTFSYIVKIEFGWLFAGCLVGLIQFIFLLGFNASDIKK